MIFTKKEVLDYWEEKPCGIKYCPYVLGTKEFFEFTEKRREKLEPFIEKYAQFDRWRGKKVLEIGCGLGIDLAKFAQAGAKVYAIDLSPQSVELSRKRLKYYSLKAEVGTGDAEELKFKNNAFDFVYSWGVLHHTPRFKKAISEIFRVLKLKGRFCLMLYHKRSLVAFKLYLLYGLFKFRPFRSINEIFAKYLESPGTRAFTKSEIKKAFSIFSGLKITTIVTPYDLRISRNLFLPNLFRKIIPKSLGFFLIVRGEK